jgi:hypothetical protein
MILGWSWKRGNSVHESYIYPMVSWIDRVIDSLAFLNNGKSTVLLGAST